MLLVWLLFLNFCAYAQKNKLQKTLVTTELAIGTISIQNLSEITQGFTLFYTNDSLRKLAALKKKKAFNTINGNRKFCIKINHGPYDFKDSNRYSFFFKIVKPVDKYLIDNLVVFRNTGFSYYQILSAISVPFEIKENKVTYVGDILIDDERGIVSVSNNFAKDSARLSERYPELNLSNAQ